MKQVKSQSQSILLTLAFSVNSAQKYGFLFDKYNKLLYNETVRAYAHSIRNKF